MDISFILILALAAGAMFLMTSRTRKQQREAQNFRSNLAPGQEVMTGSGMFGTIVEVDEEAETAETDAPAASYGSAASISSGSSKDGADDLVVPDDLSGLTEEKSEQDRDGRDKGTDSK